MFQAIQKVDFLSDDEKKDLKNSFWSVQSESYDFSPKKPFSRNLVSVWIKGVRGSTIQIIFCGLDRENWSFDEISDPCLLFSALEIFVDKLKVGASFPHRTSEKLLESSMARTFEALPVERLQIFRDKMESEILWIRKPTAKEKRYKYAHAFDKRMMFLSAARNCSFGESDYEIIENIEIDAEKKGIKKLDVGLYDVEFSLKPDAPEIVKTLFRSGLIYSPILEMLRPFIDGKITVKKAYIWKETHKTFEKYATRLGDAIKETRSELPEMQVANKALKSIYTAFFGWLGRSGEISEWKSELFRPDWRGLIVSSATANLFFNILEVFKFKGAEPFAIYHDCLMFFSNEADPLKAFEGTRLTNGDVFTHEWTLPAKRVFELIETGASAGRIDKEGKENGK